VLYHLLGGLDLSHCAWHVLGGGCGHGLCTKAGTTGRCTKFQTPRQAAPPYTYRKLRSTDNPTCIMQSSVVHTTCLRI
jgi:hypothetical protein